MEGLTARNLAQRPNCSTQPIYSLCQSMEELKNEVYNRAVDFVLSALKSHGDEKNSPAYDLAVNYLYLAQNEKQLFRAVFLSGYKKIDLNKDKFVGEEMATAYMRYSKRLSSVDEDTMRRIYLKLGVYITGIAAMINSGSADIGINEAIEMLKDMYEILLASEGISRKKS